MNKILKDILDEKAYNHLGKRPGYPVFHTSRHPYRTSISDEDLKRISSQVHLRWPEYTFKMSANQSMVSVAISVADEIVDKFKFTVREYTDMSSVESPEGVFEDHIDEFLEIVNRVLD